MDCGYAPMLRFFSVSSNGATTERQIQNRVFGQFRTSLRKDSVANYASIWTLQSFFVRGCALQRIKHFAVPSVGGATRFANLWRRYSKTEKNSAAQLCEIIRIITIYIVINSTHVQQHMRVTISCRYALSFMGHGTILLFLVTVRSRESANCRY